MSSQPFEDELLEFSLYGGRADGAVVVFALKGEGATYLVRVPREETGVYDVMAYVAAGRSDAAGRPVLAYDRYVGFQGVESGEIHKEGGEP
jgi:hypothetical protein